MGNTRKGDNPKRAAGMARKAEAASQKEAQKAAMEETDEAEKWNKGSKSTKKKEAENERKAEQLRKKQERESLLAAEEASLPSRAEPKKSKAAVKKTRGLDLSQLDDAGGPAKKGQALSATGIDNALDALSLTSDTKQTKIDRHPERRYPAAYAKFEERRLEEMEEDGSGTGLRQNQKKERIRKEFEKHPDNPFNQVTARYDASKEEVAAIRDQERTKIEKRLGSKG